MSANAAAYVLGIFPHGDGRRCQGCSAPRGVNIVFVLCLGEGFLLRVCARCSVDIAETMRASLIRRGVWGSVEADPAG